MKKVVLVEIPGVQLVLDGTPLNPLLLSYPKYPQLLLSAALAQSYGDDAVSFLDMKGDGRSSREIVSRSYGEMAYEGMTLRFDRVGLPFQALDTAVSDADVIGISCNYSMERGVAAETVAYVRARAPNALVVVGGHDATVTPAPYLVAGADYCVLGEGEAILLDLMSCQDHAEIRALRGVAFLDGGRLRRTGKRSPQSLDRLRYPSSKAVAEAGCHEYPDGPWPAGVGPAFAVLETSRGCDEACSFCSSTFVSGRFRGRSVQSILEQLGDILRAGIRTLLIADDNLLYRMLDGHGGEAGRRELIELFTEMARLGFSWTFYNGLQFGLLERGGDVDVELVEALFWNRATTRAYRGCFEIYIPLERFKPADMAKLPKLRDADTQRRILHALATQRVHRLNLGFIVGMPSDCRADLVSAMSAARGFGDLIEDGSGGKSRVNYLAWCSVPLPGTPDRSSFRDHVRYDLDAHPELHNNYVSAIEGIDMTPLDFTQTRRTIDERLNGLRPDPPGLGPAAFREENVAL